MDILTVFLQLVVHCFGCIVNTSVDMGKGHTYIIKGIFEHSFWPYVYG